MKPIIDSCVDYLKLNTFIRSILIDYDSTEISFGEHILASIAEVFGIDKSTFWVSNPDKKSYIPLSYRIKSDYIREYANQYYRIDPFHPDNILQRKVSKDIVCINDIMSYEDYEASPYYTRFVAPSGLPYYHAVMYLRHKEAIIGGIVLLKYKNEGDFSKDTISLMHEAAAIISKITAYYLLQDRLQTKETMYETLCNQSPAGFMVFDAQNPQKLYYLNPSARRYIDDILYNKTVQNLVYQFILDYILSENNFNRLGLSKVILSHSMKQYYLNVVPGKNLHKSKQSMCAYIFPLDDASNNKSSLHIRAYEILTPRQKEIINCVLKGYTNEEIAEKLFISVSTVKTHLNSIYRKLNLPNRLSLCSKLSGNIEIPS